MGASEHVKYYNAITRIEAQEALLAMSVAEFPHMSKQQDRRKRHKEMYKLAYPKVMSKPRSLNLDSIASVLNANSKKVKSG